jgi:NADH-quinone oxidoreductase subunit H
MGVSLGCIILATGSLKMTEVVAVQHGPWLDRVPWLQNWFILTPYGLIAGVIFLICMVAETNRAPFDLPEAESELIAGFHTEYSSMKFAVFFMGEYAAMMAFCGIFAVMFLGGWSPLPINWEELATSASMPWISSVGKVATHPLLAPVWLLGKIAFFMSFYIWLRATLPRLRYDQLMNLGWKALLPLAALNFVVVAIWMQFGLVAFAAAGAVLAIGYFLTVAFYIVPRQKQEKREITLVTEAKPYGG